ncbi:unnamed protein product [Nippostrongylus brasiliensis]|uniref:RNase H domain-containing protein n=1 Tax=Nippostrongylus brasiliensis TaxID=27835 RepID=A0A0N4XUZ7_NIPBR|nr:unnamed protein product [Nippostrongylus brasiliensis]
MYTERLHLRLKSEILHRNANARADLVADLLINAVKEMEIALDVRIWILTSPTHVKPSGCAVTSAVIGFMQLVAMPSKDWFVVLVKQERSRDLCMSNVKAYGAPRRLQHEECAG